MKKLTSLFVLMGLCAMPALASVASYENVSVVDVNCSKKVAAGPDSHTRDCALKCAASGLRDRDEGSTIPEVRRCRKHEGGGGSQSV
jgi:hypothetical protein